MCPRWKAQQKILWTEVREGSGRGKSRFMIRDLFADGRCSGTRLPLHHGCGKAGPAEEDAGSEVLEWERRGRREREEERRVDAEELGAGWSCRCFSPRIPS